MNKLHKVIALSQTKPMAPPLSCSFRALCFISFVSSIAAQTANTTSFSCSLDSPPGPCRAYVAYRAQAPDYLDLGSVSDLFGVSRLLIQRASNLASEEAELEPGQLLLVPLPCGCTQNISASNVTYQIKKDDSFYRVSVGDFENLTEYHVVEAMNPSLKPLLLQIGTEVVFPVFCKCPTDAQLRKGIKYLVTYVWREQDSVSGLSKLMNASESGTRTANNYRNFSAAVGHPVIVPVAQLPVLSQPAFNPRKSRSPRVVLIVICTMGGLGVIGIWCLVALLYCICYRKKAAASHRESKLQPIGLFKLKKGSQAENLSPKNLHQYKLLPGVSGYLNKPVIYDTRTIMDATMNLSKRYRIGGSVYRALINDSYFAVKQTRGDVSDELAILQKVNHANLVKLNGISTDADGNCFLIYEFAENGSLDRWLYPRSAASSSSSLMFLSWRQRLNVALDVAHGLQYMHEHTRPSVVHGDIRTSNILLSSQFKAKISNFSKTKPATESLTPKIDVHSFGILLMELLSGRKAMDMKEGAEMEEILGSEGTKEERLKKWMDPNLERFYPIDGALAIAAMARACTMEKASARPTMGDVVFGISVLLTQSSVERIEGSWTDGMTEESAENMTPVVAR